MMLLRHQKIKLIIASSSLLLLWCSSHLLASTNNNNCVVFAFTPPKIIGRHVADAGILLLQQNQNQNQNHQNQKNPMMMMLYMSSSSTTPTTTTTTTTSSSSETEEETKSSSSSSSLVTTTTSVITTKATTTTTTTSTTKDDDDDDEISTNNTSTSLLSIPQQVPAMDVLSSFATGTTTSSSSSQEDKEYKRGLLTIIFITFLFASNSPALHAAFSSVSSNPPPVLLLNAAISCIALVGLLLGGESLESNTPLPSTLSKKDNNNENDESNNNNNNNLALQGGIELGLWKMLGTTANLYGLSLTTAGHGALLIQLTTLIVPIVQGIQGVPIPRRIQFSIVLALLGVISFTQDITGSPSSIGDGLCVCAAIFYSTYDLRLFSYGKKVTPRKLITTKIGTQAILSLLLLFVIDYSNSLDYIMSTIVVNNNNNNDVNNNNWSTTVLPLILWSGIAVNAIAPYLQVGGQQAVGPTRCQTIYASQPLWAAIMSYIFLNETIGIQGFVGGSIFCLALFLAATADPPNPNCETEICEV